MHPPADLGQRKPWYTRQQIDTLPQAQAALAGRAIAWVRDPVEALVLHIQGSGRLRVQEADGSVRLVRLAYAGTNDQPYKSVGRWLLDQGLVRDATWPGITRLGAGESAARVSEMLWSNPRYVFFREEPLDGAGRRLRPQGRAGRAARRRGARSPWTARASPTARRCGWPPAAPRRSCQRLVLAQDTGSAILGAVRAGLLHRLGPRGGRDGRGA